MLNKILSTLIILTAFLTAQANTPAGYWISLEMKEKRAFINGAYSALGKIKMHHKQEVKKQYNQDINWVEPYYIERFYEILEEHRSKKVGYRVGIIAKALDAFYSNYDNEKIPLIEALRIVSLDQDGNRQKADLYLLKAQRKEIRGKKRSVGR